MPDASSSSNAVRPPTARQRRVLDFVDSFLARRGFPPTHAEIAEGLGFASPNAAREHVRLLVKKGLVEVTPGASRGIRVVGAAEKPRGARRTVEREDGADAGLVRGLPLVGRVAAGAPILAVEHVERTVEIDPGAFRPRADYLLRVRGDSMIERGILDGDFVAVSRTARATPGAVVVARLDDEVTVKTWRTDGRRVVLEPANAALKPLVVDPARRKLAVEGVVVGLLRTGDRR